MRLAFLIASLTSAVLIPLVVVSTVVLGLIDDASFYHAGQVRYEVQNSTGMAQAEIDRVNLAIVRFFDGSEALPDALQASGASPAVFQPKEILHMNDVREVIRTITILRVWSAALVGVFAIAVVARWKKLGRWALSRTLVVSSVLTIVVGGLAAAVTYVAFDALFLAFHEITFHNDYWELDPRTDHLIQMFPFGFWYDAMLSVALRVVVVTLLLFVIGIALGRRGQGRWRQT